jgi:hypothetical protein
MSHRRVACPGRDERIDLRRIEERVNLISPQRGSDQVRRLGQRILKTGDVDSQQMLERPEPPGLLRPRPIECLVQIVLWSAVSYAFRAVLPSQKAMAVIGSNCPNHGRSCDSCASNASDTVT